MSLTKRCFAFMLVAALILVCGSTFVQESQSLVPLPHRIAVTSKDCDDMAKVLQDLGLSPEAIQEQDLRSADKLRQYEAIFINCSMTIDDFVDAGPIIREYVRNGGAIYASDNASSIVNAAFPGKMELYYDKTAAQEYGEFYGSRVGFAGSYQANVPDTNLTAFLGKNTIEVRFNGPGWTVIKSIASDVDTIIEGPVNIEDYSTNPETNHIELPGKKPYAIAFSEGKGEVLYSNFHYEDQSTSDVASVLDWFAIRVASGTLLQSTRKMAIEKGGKTLFEVIDGVRTGETKTYKVKANPKHDLNVILNSHHSGFSIQIIDPNNKDVVRENNVQIPFDKRIDAVSGEYTIKISTQTSLSRVLPYALIVTEQPKKTTKDNKDNKDQKEKPKEDTKKPFPLSPFLICGACACMITIVILVIAVLVIVVLNSRKGTQGNN